MIKNFKKNEEINNENGNNEFIINERLDVGGTTEFGIFILFLCLLRKNYYYDNLIKLPVYIFEVFNKCSCSHIQKFKLLYHLKTQV